MPSQTPPGGGSQDTPRPSPHLRLVEGSGRRRASTAQVPSHEPALTADETVEPTARSTRRASPPVSGPGRQLTALLALDDARLVEIARAGDKLALEALYRKHVSFAIHLATRIEGSSRDVEDVVHDAFIKAFGRLSDLADPAAFRSWLGSIVVFAVRSRLRRLRLMNMLGLGRGADPVDLDSLASPDTSPHTRAQLAQIYALLMTRPLDDRIAWTLRHVEGHELEVVARLCTCSLATVKRRISRVQVFLEEHFVQTPAPESVPPASQERVDSSERHDDPAASPAERPPTGSTVP
jgi:RNA polymerase sigma-70 factor (ECF subfamily)